MPVTLAPAAERSVHDAVRRGRAEWWLGYVAVIAFALLITGLALLRSPESFPLLVGLLIAAAALVFWRPVTGIFLAIPLAMLGDAQTASWYPVYKNFSSQESDLYLGDSLIVSPLEVLLFLTVVSWVLHMVGRNRLRFERGTLFWPVMAFGAFVLVGLAYGLATGGDSNVGLWEARPLLYIPVVYVLVTNLFTRREHYDWLFWAITIALAIDAVLAYIFFRRLTPAQQLMREDLGEHTASLHLNTLYLLAIASWMYRRVSTWRRLLLPAIALPTIWVYLEANRRAAMITLAVGFLLLFVELSRVNRRLFLRTLPVLLVVAIGYTGAFWNSTTAIGAPAQSIKSVIAPEELSEKDQSSNLYRILENVNLVATVRAEPLTGVGFGNKFLRVVALADISSFIWYEYVPHNAILWIWLKMGVGGFVTLLYLLGSAIREGVRALPRIPDDDQSALALIATIYVVMFAVFAFVDISWDSQTSLYLALSFALIGNVVRLNAGRPLTAAANPAEAR